MSHKHQYPKGTTKVYSYLESRGGEFDKLVFFGLQYYLKNYMEGKVIEPWMIDEAEELAAIHFGNDKIFDRSGWDYIVNELDGKLPLLIKAVDEGTVVNNKNVLFSIENTDDQCYWLTNMVETLLLKVWYPTTVASLSRSCKQTIKTFLDQTSDDSSGLSFKLHDFMYRGVSSEETSALGAAAHLINFLGTDTISGILLARDFYNAGKCCGFSIPASEHSTITSWTKARELEACENILDTYPEGLVACVSDSYDIFACCRDIWGDKLKEKILNRNGTLVIRPDSGDPVVVLIELLNILGNSFGYTINTKGYKILDPHIRLIWGDGINQHSIKVILEAVESNGWSTDNIAMGMGGALGQMVNRDTNKFAIKCSMAIVSGEEVMVYKDPITDHGKVSKKGRLFLTKDENGLFKTIEQGSYNGEKDYLETVFLNGELTKEVNFEQIRSNASL